jgi:putative transposase
MIAATNPRESRGIQIAQAKQNQISRIDEGFYTVKSQSGNGEYVVNKINGEWTCQCPDHTHRHVVCKHIHAVTFSQSVRAEVAVNRVIPELNINACQYCGATEIVRDGVRHNKQGDLQVYVCKKCGKHTTLNLGFKGMRATPQIITSAMQLYFTGESYRNVQKFLKLQGVAISHVAVMKWIKKYVELMDAYVKKIVPNVSDKWRADEMYIKVAGNMKYLYAMMDDETRFWIAQEVADSKFKHDSREIFYQARWLMKKQPKIFITDGLPTYKTNARRIFPEAKHIRHITLDGAPHNNKMERMNGEVRDREKTMRGLKKMDTPILKGYQIYHNYIRPHEALDGKTPSEACGITIEGKNKWVTLIQNASKTKK